MGYGEYKTCNYANKRMYATKADALFFVKKPKVPVYNDGRRVKRRMNKRKELRVYYCEDCQHWHVSSKKYVPNDKK